jgi:quercetin dioxygenase-like cupin family protein
MEAIEKRLVVGANEGNVVWLGGVGVQFKVDGDDTSGAFSVVEHPLKPGAATPPHTHAHEDEYSYVLEGKIGARIGDKVVEATPGMYVFKPRGVPHAFWNAGPEPARILEIIAPAGFEQYFADMAPLFNGPEPPDPAKVAEIAARYDLTYHMDHMDWIPDLSAYENANR